MRVWDEWVRRGEAFQRMAERSFNESEYLLTCFGAEQAVQFVPKAALIKLTGSKPYSHKISTLLELLCKELNEPLDQKLFRDALLLESRYYARYPDAQPEPPT
ncbi:MAG: HEPN domain-containing protein [Candidatus Caldarchaeum sp.]|nr:HEPN domain-containing protein [Candidatus Caldarchaeum sp.]